MENDRRCRWVRHRLPLLAGGELGVEERRKVERHLIGCLGCRDRRDASTGALAALRAVAEETSFGTDAPSLWPSLSRQIRESRHVSPRSSWWEAAIARPWPSFGLSLALGGAVTAIAMAPGREAPLAPVAPAVTVETTATKPAIAASPAPRNARPSVPRRPIVAPSSPNADPFAAPSGLRVDYDLDHATPMSPGHNDPQHSY